MDLRNLLIKIMDEYVDEKEHKCIAKNELAKLFQRGLDGVVSSDLIGGNLESNGSAGKGRWATIPWIGIFDSDISTSASKGFYIVYLFSADMNTVYLSLNQGWTYFNDRFKGQKNKAEYYIDKVSKYFQANILTNSENITTNPMDLGSKYIKNSKLPKGYEFGNVVSIGYKKGMIPSNDILIQDLKDMIMCFDHLKSILLNPTKFEESIDYIFSQLSIESNNPEKKEDDKQHTHKFRKNLEREISNKLDVLQLKETEASYNIKKNTLVNTPKKYTGVRRNYELQNIDNSKIGFLGEKIILQNEMNNLKDYPDLREKIEHASKTKGDGLGYDILSFEVDGSPKYIEVKTTKDDITTPFFVSENELSFSKENSNNYFLYRIYDFSKVLQDDTIKFYKRKGTLTDSFDLVPSTFKSFLK